MSEDLPKPIRPVVRLNRRNVPSEEFIADLRRVAHVQQKNTVSAADYRDNGRFAPGTLANRFGSWGAALAAAGLVRGLEPVDNHEALFENLLDAWTQLGRQPKYSEMRRPLSRWSTKPYEKRFGTWNAALVAFARFVDTEVDDNATSATSSEQGRSSQRRTSRFPNLRLRWKVLSRDFFKCKCGRTPATDPSVKLHVDHVIAWSNGGETILDNLQTLCDLCNLGKGAL